MEEWKEYKLKDFLLIPIRNGLTKPSAIRGKGVKMIGMKEIFAMDYIRSVDMDRVPVTDKEYESSEILKYDLLFARQSLSLEGAGKCGIVVSVDEPTVFESHLIRLRIDTKKANPFFIYYYYKSSIGKNQIKSLVQQVAAAGIRGKELIELGLKVPHIEKQNQIADILRAIDNKIEVNRRINDNLEQQAQALFKSWFVDFEPFRDQPFVESELGMIPEGWRVVSFKDFIEVSTEKAPVDCYPEYSVTNNGIIPRNTKFNKKLSKSSSKNKVLKKNDLVFGMSREILNWGIMEDEVGGVSSAYNVYKIDKGIVSPTYLRLYMKARISDFNSLIGTAAREGQSLDKGQLLQKQIYIPTITALQDFLDLFLPITETQLNYLEESRRLAQLRDTLLPRLMSGEIKVEDVTL